MKPRFEQRFAHRPLTAYPPRLKRYEPTANYITVTLRCGHTNDFPEPAPAIGQTAYCRACERYARVTKETNDATT
jgi:hypothetical protein